MADIELVIKIPERVYNYVRKYEHIANSAQSDEHSTTSRLCDSATLKASIAVRNFPLSAEALRKHLGFKDGDDFYIFGTTMKGEKKMLILGSKC